MLRIDERLRRWGNSQQRAGSRGQGPLARLTEDWHPPWPNCCSRTERCARFPAGVAFVAAMAWRLPNGPPTATPPGRPKLFMEVPQPYQ